MINNKLIFLTSTVRPSSNQFVGTIDQRKNEYIKAIKFYLAHTVLRVLIVDNSGYNFYNEISSSERFESLSYIEESNDKGKGYGELKIMEYGFKHSKFITSCDVIVKITGRHVIKNIQELLTTSNVNKSVWCDCNLRLSFAMTYFIIGPKEFYERLFCQVDKLDDKNNIYLEHIVAELIRKYFNEGNYHEFKIPIYIQGHPGISNQEYPRPGIKRFFLIFVKYILNELRSIINQLLISLKCSMYKNGFL